MSVPAERSMGKPVGLLVRPASPPTAQTVASWQSQLRQAMFEVLDADAIRDIMGAIIEQARKGDLAAARLVLTYAVGSPTVVVKNAVIHNNQSPAPAPLPVAPSKGLPRTELRMTDMGKRAERGLPLHDPRDARVGGGDD